jgi:hypothetical protein
MPWPATHILAAEKAFDRHFQHLDHTVFLLGTCFPDIRYPAGVERERTHRKNITLGEVQEETAFQAGLLFHSLVDGLWNSFIRAHAEPLFALVPHNRPMFHTMKILQDKFLYSELTHWDRIVAVFSHIPPEALTFGVDRAMVQRWYAMLSHYLSKPPNQDDLEMLALSLPPDLLADIRSYYQQYQTQPELNRILRAFYRQFDSLLARSASRD